MSFTNARNARDQRHSRQSGLPRLETQPPQDNRFSFTMTPAQAHNATFDGPEFSRPETIFDDESPVNEHEDRETAQQIHPPIAPLPALPDHVFSAANRHTAPLPPLPPEAYETAHPTTSPTSHRVQTYELPASNTSPQETQWMSSQTPAYDDAKKQAYSGLGLSSASPPPNEVHPALRSSQTDTQPSMVFQAPPLPLSPVSHSSHAYTQSHSSTAPSPFTPSTVKSGPYSLDQKKTAAATPLDFYSPYDHPPQTPRTASVPMYTPGSPLGPNASVYNLRHQPVQNTLPATDTSTTKIWHSSTLSPSASCFSSLFCPCIVYGRVQYRLSQRSKKAEPTDLLGYSAVNGQCGMMALACGFQGILATIQRTRVRRAYGIEGDMCGDCMRGCCCCCCTIGLSESEMVHREEERRKLASATNTSGYLNTGRLTYMPPPRS